MRDKRFGCVLDERERELLATLAEKLERTQSDTIRVLVREASDRLGLNDTSASHNNAVAG